MVKEDESTDMKAWVHRIVRDLYRVNPGSGRRPILKRTRPSFIVLPSLHQRGGA